MHTNLSIASTRVAEVDAGNLIRIPVGWYTHYALVCSQVSADKRTFVAFMSSAGDVHAGHHADIAGDCICLDFGNDFVFNPTVRSAYIERLEHYSHPGTAVLDGNRIYVVGRTHGEDDGALLIDLTTGAVVSIPDHPVVKFAEWAIGVRSAGGAIERLCEYKEPEEITVKIAREQT